MKRYIVLVLIVAFILPACERPGGGERAGERVDEIVDNVKEGEAPLKRKGPLEELGESLDETTRSDRR